MDYQPENDSNLVSEHLKALLQVSSALSSSLDLTEVLNTALDQVLHLLQAERGLIMLSENGELSVKVAKSFLEDDLLEGREISHGVIEKSFHEGQPVVTMNAMDDQRFARNQSVIAYQLRSVMCVPLRCKDQTIGIIYLDNRWRTGIFNNRDLETLATFANHCAIAIENARLFANLRNSMTEQLKLQEVIFKERTSAEVERETSKLREDLAHYLVHDLRNPLTIVQSAFGMLKNYVRLPEAEPEDIELLRRCELSLGVISKMLSDILDVYLLENSAMQLKKECFDLKALLSGMAESFLLVKKNDVGLELRLPEDRLDVLGDINLLSRVMSNLVQNACQWTHEGCITISAGYLEPDPGFWAEVRDTGPGIPLEFRQKIFSKFNRVDRKDQPVQSRGLGLAFCKLAVAAHGGSIEVLDNPGGGTRIRIEIPAGPACR